MDNNILDITLRFGVLPFTGYQIIYSFLYLFTAIFFFFGTFRIAFLYYNGGSFKSMLYSLIPFLFCFPFTYYFGGLGIEIITLEEPKESFSTVCLNNETESKIEYLGNVFYLSKRSQGFYDENKNYRLSCQFSTSLMLLGFNKGYE